MKFVLSDHAIERFQTRGLELSWIETVLTHPTWREPDPTGDGRIRAFAPIPERDDRILRVVYVPLPDSIRVISAFFDRGAPRYLASRQET